MIELNEKPGYILDEILTSINTLGEIVISSYDLSNSLIQIKLKDFGFRP